MPKFDKYEDKSKTLFIRFKCNRCGFEEFEKLEDCDKRTGERGDYLHQLLLPRGWLYEQFLGRALCPDCNRAYDEFMKGCDTND